MRNVTRILAALVFAVSAVAFAHAADAIDEIPSAPESVDAMPATNWEGAYIGGKITHQWDIDFTNQSINITPSSSGQVNYLNNQNFCGRNSWSLNTSVEVSGLTCLGSYLSDVGDVDYDIVEYYFSVKSNPLVANTAPGNLYFGLSEAGANGASASARRKTFNGNIVYRKQ